MAIDVQQLTDGILIDGDWRAATSDRTFTVVDPSTSNAVQEVADASTSDAAAAAAAAARAQASFAAVAPRARAEMLRASFVAMQDSKEDLAHTITLETGKPLRESRAEIDYAADFFRWFSEVAAHVDGGNRTKPAGGGTVASLREPVGPCLLITPWNFPAAMVARKVAAAIAAGCTSVLKPAEQTPLTALRLARILQDSGVPDGVVNVVPTSDPGGVTRAVVETGHIRKLSFTGSTSVGRELLALASTSVLRVSMELGGNAPFLVFDDADLDAAVEGAMVAKLRNGGQSCVAANRFYVQESVAGDFTAALAARIEAVRVGPGSDETSDMGPMIDRSAVERVNGLVERLDAAGASLLGGADQQLPTGGSFVEPVLAELGERHDVLGDVEVFGPIAPVMTFSDETQALAAANDTQYGLVAFAYTADLARANRVARGLQVGMVGVNTGLVSDAGAPFGGVKQSGLGREGGAEGIAEYLETKYLAIAT